MDLFNGLTNHEKQFILWFNSRKHHEIFHNADMCFVLNSFKDIAPDKKYKLNYDPEIDKPLIFLQKDSCNLIKKDITGESFDFNIFRYLVYDKNTFKYLNDENNFKEYQLKYVKAPFKFNSHLLKDMDFLTNNKIFWFVDWRCYGENRGILIDNIISILKSSKLNEYLVENNLGLTICLHHYYKKENSDMFAECESENIEIKYPHDFKIDNDVINSKLIIADFSSIAFDLTLFKKPVILYQPDFDYILTKRQFYIDSQDVEKFIVKEKEDLINQIIEEVYDINPILDIWDSDIYEIIKDDSHIKEEYDYFYNTQMNKITFLGYSFYSIGGTVNATHGLVEKLIEEGYLIEMNSMFRFKTKHPLTNGVNYTYNYNKRISSQRIQAILLKPVRYYGYLKHETNMDLINSYLTFKLRNKVKNIKSNTVVSTRETLHLFLEESNSPYVKNKLYFYHAAADIIDTMYKGLIDKLKKKTLDKVLFVTNNNRLEFKRIHNYDNYNSFIITGNSLESSKIIDRDLIKPVPKKDKYVGIFLIRMSPERQADLDNLIDFGVYLRDNNITNIIIDIYGSGLCEEYLTQRIYEEDLERIINFKFRTDTPIQEIRKHDFLCDLSLKQSFGMTYLEGILNGKKVFCTENLGSSEVMKDIPNSFIESYEWLVDQINNLPNISVEELQNNYDTIYDKYSQEALCNKFISLLDLYRSE